MKFSRLAAASLLLIPMISARAQVVINEVFYNAPNEHDDVQWIELLNTSARSVDLSGWSLDKGKFFVFPKGAAISPTASHALRSSVVALTILGFVGDSVKPLTFNHPVAGNRE